MHFVHFKAFIMMKTIFCSMKQNCCSWSRDSLEAFDNSFRYTNICSAVSDCTLCT